MKRFLILTLALIFCSGCAAVQKAEDVLGWTKDKLDKIDAKVESVKAEQAARVEKYEAIVGAFDRNGDGSVSLQESKEVLAEASKTPDGRKLYFDPEFYATLALAAAGLYGAKRGVQKLYNGPATPTPPAA